MAHRVNIVLPSSAAAAAAAASARSCVNSIVPGRSRHRATTATAGEALSSMMAAAALTTTTTTTTTSKAAVPLFVSSTTIGFCPVGDGTGGLRGRYSYVNNSYIYNRPPMNSINNIQPQFRRQHLRRRSSRTLVVLTGRTFATASRRSPAMAMATAVAGNSNSNRTQRTKSGEKEDDDDEDGLMKLFTGGSPSTIREYQNPWSTGPDATDDDGSVTPSPSSSSSSSSSPSPSPSPNLLLLGNLDDDDPVLDRQSRFLIELLQTLYQVGLTKTVDRVTTVRANAMIERLSRVPMASAGEGGDYSINEGGGGDVSSSASASASLASLTSHPIGRGVGVSRPITPTTTSGSSSSSTATLYWQRAERARAILECMELFRVYLNRPEPLLFRVPVPTHETYWNVLRMYASKTMMGLEEEESAFVTLPPLTPCHSICRNIVERMDATGELALKPKSMHWNQVLSAYAHASPTIHPRRPIDAAHLLYELDARGLTDESSFSHTLRSCCVVNVGGGAGIASPVVVTPQFAELSLGVAQRVWKGLQQKQPQQQGAGNNNNNGKSNSNPAAAIVMQSYHFVHMMRVARNFAFLDPPGGGAKKNPAPNGGGSDDDDRRQRQKEWIRQTFQECADRQRVNKHVLLELIHQGSSPSPSSGDNDGDEGEDWILSQVLHLDARTVKSLQHRRPLQAKELIRFIPSKWLAHAD